MSSLEAYKNNFLIELELKGRHVSTIKRYRFDLNDFFTWYRIMESIQQNQLILSHHTIQAYFSYLITERAYSIASIKRIRTVLNQYFKFLLESGFTNENMMENVCIPQLTDIQPFHQRDFVSKKEIKQLIDSIISTHSLSEKQLKAHYLLKIRNKAIILLLYNYGLTLKELTNLQISKIHFLQKEIHIVSETSMSRTIKIHENDSHLLYNYLQSIPAPNRPGTKKSDPFFIAFDFARNTYRWDYKEDQPKKLTDIAIQKMIRLELRRANLRRDITPQHFRRSAILNFLKEGVCNEDIIHHFGFKAKNSLSRYLHFLKDVG